jgi:molybdenum cofactor sulfurtransferase
MWMLDASKLAATSVVNLSTLSEEDRPDFVCLSFYKMFGYPTGLGALLMKRSSAMSLRKRSFCFLITLLFCSIFKFI